MLVGGLVTERIDEETTAHPPSRWAAQEHEAITHAREITHRFRKRKGWTCKEAGLASELSDSTISHWEVGRLILSLPALLREAFAVEVPLAWLFADPVEGPLRDLIEKLALLSPAQQQNLNDMVDGLLTAELHRRDLESGHHEACA